MAREKKGYQGDLSKLDTRAGARRTSQADLDASRQRAAGIPAKPDPRNERGLAVPHNPELQAWASAEIVDRAKRSVIGLIDIKGRSPVYTLSHGQFQEFQETGAWSGEPRMPTVEEYGPQHHVPEDKEYVPYE